MTDDIRIEDYPARATDKIRYGDTDRQGHVNNAVFTTFLETGRVELLYDPADPLLAPGTSYVLARIALDYRAELNWPGVVEIGTRVLAVGRSSVRLGQAVFQNGRCAAVGETVVVMTDDATRRSTPLPEPIAARLRALAGGA